MSLDFTEGGVLCLTEWTKILSFWREFIYLLSKQSIVFQPQSTHYSTSLNWEQLSYMLRYPVSQNPYLILKKKYVHVSMDRSCRTFSFDLNVRQHYVNNTRTRTAYTKIRIRFIYSSNSLTVVLMQGCSKLTFVVWKLLKYPAFSWRQYHVPLEGGLVVKL